MNSSEHRLILCGTDFSIHAAEAADVAAALARSLNEPLLLVYVEDPGALAASHPEILSLWRERSRERLAAEAQRLRLAGTVVQEKILTGSPHEALVKTAADTAARLVVVASIGRVAPMRLIAGSVAERTAESSTAPTLVVRGGTNLAAWARGEQTLKIVVGCDFSSSTEAALHWLREWRSLGPCDITVAHVDSPARESLRLGLTSPESVTENPPAVARILERDLQEHAAAILGDGSVSVAVIPGSHHVEDHLLTLAREQKADLLIVGTHQRHGLSRLWLGSVSRGVLHHSPSSVMVIPLSAVTERPSDGIPQIKRVLVPTDLSELGNSAIPFAHSVLRRGGTHKIMHVIPPWEPPDPTMAQCEPERTSPQHHRRWAAAVLQQLRSLLPPTLTAHGILAEVEVVESQNPPQAIRETAERFGADLICLSSHGRSGLARAVLGSVADGVIQHSFRPVLVVPPSTP